MSNGNPLNSLGAAFVGFLFGVVSTICYKNLIKETRYDVVVLPPKEPQPDTPKVENPAPKTEETTHTPEEAPVTL